MIRICFLMSLFMFAPLDGVSARTPLPPQPRPEIKYILAIFGDSLSDNGNTFRAAKVPDADLYWRGRYTDGPNWVDYLQAAIPQKYQLQIFNYAYGSATACPDTLVTTHFPFVKNLTGQMEAFIADVTSGKVPAPGKYVKLVPVQWIGSNDVLFAFQRTAASNASFDNAAATALLQSMIGCRIASARVLATIPGVKDVVLLPLAPLHSSPAVPGALKAMVLQLEILIAQQTAAAVASLQANLDAAKAGVKVHLLGDFSWIETGFSTITPAYKQLNVSCFINPLSAMLQLPETVTICDNPTEHLFYDEAHPETRFHQWFASKGFLPRMRKLHLLP